MRLNLNDGIKVKLTEHGKDIYYHQYDQINTAFGREVCKPGYPKVDEDGYTTFQLWCFMELYGVHMGITLPNVIDPLDIVFDAPTIELEQKWIPCSERLPERNRVVLVTTKWGEVTEGVKLSGNAWFIGRGEENAFDSDIIAWMPKPEPYKEGGAV